MKNINITPSQFDVANQKFRSTTMNQNEKNNKVPSKPQVYSSRSNNKLGKSFGNKINVTDQSISEI